MFGQPVLVFAGTKETWRTAHPRALARGLALSIFTAGFFATGNDHDSRAAVAAVARDDLDLAGLALHADRELIDKVVKGARMHL